MKWKLGILFLLVILVPLMVASQLVDAIVAQGMNAELDARVEASAELAVTMVDRSMRRLERWARTIAQAPRIRDCVAAADVVQLVDRLEDVRSEQELNLFGGTIEVVDGGGDLVASVPRSQAEAVLVADESAVARALAGQQPMTVRRLGGMVQVTAAHPIYHEKSPLPIGVVALSFFTNDTYADQINRIVKSHVIVFDDVDGQSRVLASTLFSGTKRARPVFAMRQAHRTTLVLDGQHYALRSRPVTAVDGPFFVGVLHDRRTLEATLRSVRDTLTGIALVTMTLALLAAVFFARKHIVAPITALVRSAQALGGGDLDTPVVMTSDDEFEFLAETFDGMRCRIKATMATLDRRVYELSLMDGINQAIIKSPGHTLLARVLQLVADELGAEHASIMLTEVAAATDEGDGGGGSGSGGSGSGLRLVLRHVYTRGGDEMAARPYVQLEVGEGLAGRAAAERNPCSATTCVRTTGSSAMPAPTSAWACATCSAYP